MILFLLYINFLIKSIGIINNAYARVLVEALDIPSKIEEIKKISKEDIINVGKKVCLYSKFCIKANKHIPNDGMENCFMALEEEKKDIPSGAYYVRFVRKGYLYVEINDNQVVEIKDTLGNVTNYVYIKQVGDEYQVSLTPFNEIKKKNNRKKANA